MKLDLSQVEFSRKDLIKNITVPSKLNSELSYFIGIHLGDGFMNYYEKYYYSIAYSGHLFDENEFYKNYIWNLFKKFFNKELYIYERFRPNKQSIDLTTQSKGIFTFLNKSLGIKAGPKTNTPIPKIIFNSKYRLDFIRGLADSDFCLTFKSDAYGFHRYPTISIDGSNKILIQQTNELLNKFNFKTSTLFDFPKKRYEKIYISNQLEILGEKQLEKWMSTIGFNSRKHLTKYLIWKKFGFCPPFTSLFQREQILNSKLDP